MQNKEYTGKLVFIEGYWFFRLDKFPHIQVDMGDSMQDLAEYEELMKDAQGNGSKNDN